MPSTKEIMKGKCSLAVQIKEHRRMTVDLSLGRCSRLSRSFAWESHLVHALTLEYNLTVDKYYPIIC